MSGLYRGQEGAFQEKQQSANENGNTTNAKNCSQEKVEQKRAKNIVK